MNIFQQVFAQVGNKNEKNSDESDNMMPNLKSKFQTTSSIQRSSRNPLQAKNQNVLNTQKIDKEMVNKNPSMKYSQNFRQANKTKKQENINYMETLHEIKKKVYDMEHKILIKQNEFEESVNYFDAMMIVLYNCHKTFVRLPINPKKKDLLRIQICG